MIESKIYQRYKGKTIVVIAADEFMRSVLNAHLRLIPDIAIDSYSDGEYALDGLQHHGKDTYLIIAQSHLEQLSGFSLVKKIRSGDLHITRSLPVIIFGPEAGGLHLRELAKKLDVNVYLEEPINYSSMISALDKADTAKLHLMPAITYAKIATDTID